MTQQTSGMPELKYSEETFRDMYEACKLTQKYFQDCFAVWAKGERIMPTDEEVVRVAGNELDTMADTAFEATEKALAKAEGGK